MSQALGDEMVGDDENHVLASGKETLQARKREKVASIVDDLHVS